MKYKALLWNPRCLWQLGRNRMWKALHPLTDHGQPRHKHFEINFTPSHLLTQLCLHSWYMGRSIHPGSLPQPQPSQDTYCVFSCAKRWQDHSPCFWATHDPACCVSKEEDVEGAIWKAQRGSSTQRLRERFQRPEDPSAESEGHMRAWQANMEGVMRRGWGEQGYETRRNVAEVHKNITTPGRECARWILSENDGKDVIKATSQAYPKRECGCSSRPLQ